MAVGKVNPDKVYHNHHGQFPAVGNGLSEPTPIPIQSSVTHPKRITDTTLRDGAQDPSFALFPHDAKLKYFDLLHQLDNKTGRIENVEVFIYQKRDRWVLEKLLERGFEFPKVTTWTRATPKDIRLLVKIGQGRIEETGMLASSSDHHIFDKLKHRSKESAIEKYLAPIMTAVEHGIRPRVHLEDVTKADITGWVVPFIQRVLQETRGKACFRLCDTMGWGVPDPYADLPTGIPKLVATIQAETGAELEFHGHNDFGLATANSLAAWTYGCNRVNVAYGGLGERTGNTPLEQMVAGLVRVEGNPGLNLRILSELASLINGEVCRLPAKVPIVGSHIFTTQAGLHQSGVAAQAEAPGGLIYLPYSATTVGRGEENLHRVGGVSGMDGLVAMLNKELASRGEEPRYTTVSRTVLALYEKVHAAYDGRYDEVANSFVDARRDFFEPAELLELVQQIEEGG